MALLTRWVVRRESLREALWKAALVGGVVTATRSETGTRAEAGTSREMETVGQPAGHVAGAAAPGSSGEEAEATWGGETPAW